MSRRTEAAVFLDDAQRRAILRSVFAGYYHEAGPAAVVFDTNRLWCARMGALAGLFPEARVICCVRDVFWIMDSIERQASHNPFELSGLFGYEPGARSTPGSRGWRAATAWWATHSTHYAKPASGRIRSG